MKLLIFITLANNRIKNKNNMRLPLQQITPHAADSLDHAHVGLCKNENDTITNQSQWLKTKYINWEVYAAGCRVVVVVAGVRTTPTPADFGREWELERCVFSALPHVAAIVTDLGAQNTNLRVGSRDDSFNLTPFESRILQWEGYDSKSDMYRRRVVKNQWLLRLSVIFLWDPCDFKWQWENWLLCISWVREKYIRSRWKSNFGLTWFC